jgi:hypothetical protein
VWTYRVLVSHEHVPLWKNSSIRGVAYHEHLYTRVAAGTETDEVERWLDREFEAPAEEAIHKVISNARLTPTDWKQLVRFVAAQDVRTPARLIENLQRWHASFPEFIQTTLERSVRKLEELNRSGTPIPEDNAPDADYIPLRVTTAIEPGQEVGLLKAETILGRGLWLFSIRHLLTKTLNALHRHRWTILIPPDDLTWFTSDDPVIRLNYYRPGHYDLRGGWGSPGTDILLPLGPRHLLHAVVGKRPPPRGTVLPRSQSEEVRRIIAEHAHRMIIAAERDPDIPQLRPRIVNAEALRRESEQWRNWHAEQTAAERELMGWAEQPADEASPRLTNG